MGKETRGRPVGLLALPVLLAVLGGAAGTPSADGGTATACARPAGSQTLTTSYPQDSHASFWTVPADVHSVCVEIVGAPGGDTTATYRGNPLGGAGGNGADVVAQLAVSPGQVYGLGAGAAVGDLVSYDADSRHWSSAATSPYSFQGGTGAYGGQPGGYASVVALWAPNQFADPSQESYYTLGHFDTVVAVAGGGGGAGGPGATSGADGLPGPGATGGNGGTPDGQTGAGAGGGGAGGSAPGTGGVGFGNGGTGSDGDLDETWDNWQFRSPEWLGRGGAGASGVQYNGALCDADRFGGWSGGGGGGGGWHGGGGGGRGAYDDSGTCLTSEPGGGGGGGSSYVDPAFVESGTDVSYGVADHTAAPSITLVWTAAGADTTPPTITGVPAPATVEAISSAGAAFEYAQPTATDVVDGPVAVTCTPASGSTFPLGTTSVACAATDAAGNAASAQFTVAVVDTTAPRLSLPAPISTAATSSSGAAVSFSATATDLVDGSVAVACSPASGSTFAVGTTTVSCSAVDRAGNAAGGSFAVTVAAQQTGGGGSSGGGSSSSGGSPRGGPPSPPPPTTPAPTPPRPPALTKPVTIRLPNLPPRPAFVTAARARLVRFDARGSGDADGRIVRYRWSFGDGRSATGARATHRYARAGRHVVRLTVTDDDGASVTAAAPVVVKGAASLTVTEVVSVTDPWVLAPAVSIVVTEAVTGVGAVETAPGKSITIDEHVGVGDAGAPGKPTAPARAKKRSVTRKKSTRGGSR